MARELSGYDASIRSALSSRLRYAFSSGLHACSNTVDRISIELITLNLMFWGAFCKTVVKKGAGVTRSALGLSNSSVVSDNTCTRFYSTVNVPYP